MMQRSAVLSTDREYCYRLERTWNARLKRVLWVTLNPSTADEVVDDQTVKRCIAFSDAWGFGGLVVGNLFALRSADPSVVVRHHDPVGPENDGHLLSMAEECSVVVAAWGGSLVGEDVFHLRERAVRKLLAGRMMCMGITYQARPRHPSRMKAGPELFEYW